MSRAAVSAAGDSKRSPTDDVLPTGEAKRAAVKSMFDTIAPRYDLVNRLMTFRMDVGWRRRTVDALGLTPGSLVADIACGTGDLCRDLERAQMRPIGIDLSYGMLASARTQAPLLQGDALSLPIRTASVTGLTCGFALRNFVDLAPFFIEAARVMRRGGRIALVEVASPPNPVLAWGHGIYFGKVVPQIGALLSDRAAYRYLPKSVSYLPPVEDMLDTLRSAGFTHVERTLLSTGIAQLITATRA